MNTTWTVIPIIIVAYGVLTLALYTIALKDFNHRKFSSLNDKQKYKKLLFNAPFGVYRYLLKVKHAKEQ